MCGLRAVGILGDMWQRSRPDDVAWMVRRTVPALFALLAGLVLAAPAGAVPFTSPLPIPQVIDQPEITIHAAPSPVQILPAPAPATTMWTFNGTFPGPTIRRRVGETTKVTFANDLPADSGDLTIHNHGEHPQSADDGQPDDELIAPGGDKTYTYDATKTNAASHG